MKLNFKAAALKRPVVYIPALIVLLALGGIIYAKSSGTAVAQTDLITVTRGQVTETVSVTGNTKSSSLVDLGFERSGRIGRVYAKVGDRVAAGDLIVALSNDDLSAALRAEEARLAALVRGTRTEQLAIDQAQAGGAQTSLANAQSSLISTMNEVYVVADDAVRNKADDLFDDARTVNPRFKYRIGAKNNFIKINDERLLAEEALVKWQGSLNTLNTASLDSYVTQAQSTLVQIKNFLNDLSLLVNDLTTNDGIIQANLDKFKTNVSSARSAVNTAISSLSSAHDAWLSASSALSVEKNQLNLAVSGSASEDVAAQQAQVDSAHAALAKTIITAPFEGILTRQDGISGEIVSANARIATVLDDKHYEIEADVPEVDIGRIALKDPVAITLDAFPGQTFAGSVSYIEPSETIIDGVVNFKIKVALDMTTVAIKTGLTANLEIETQKKSGVLVLPQTALIETDSGIFVKKLDGKASTQIPVRVGIRGVDGSVEILSGVAEGDQVENVALKKP